MGEDIQLHWAHEDISVGTRLRLYSLQGEMNFSVNQDINSESECGSFKTFGSLNFDLGPSFGKIPCHCK